MIQVTLVPVLRLGLERATSYKNTPSQCLADAIKSCAGSEMPARLLEAAKQARGGAWSPPASTKD